MLEILVIVIVSNKIAAMQREKGRTAAGYVVLFIALWLGGEIFGAIAGVVASLLMDRGGPDNDGFFVVYILALIAALTSTTTVSRILASKSARQVLPSPPPPPEFSA